MTLVRKTLALVAVALLGLGVADARAADPATYEIAANVNDPGIDTSRGAHLVWLAPAGRRVGKLLLFMPSGGATNLPGDWREMGTEGARLGYHTIVLAYKNEAPIAAAPPAGCGNSVEPPASPPDCAFNARMEILDGRGESTVVNVDRANSIENRLTKTLQYLAATFPAEGWSAFLDTSGAEAAPRWSEIVAGGASLGGAQAVLIAQLHSVYRAAVFHGWTDAKHGWVAVGATPSSRYSTLIHQRDNFFARTCFGYLALGLAPSCPLPGFTIPPALPDTANPLLVDNRQPPFGTRQLVFNLEPNPLGGAINDPYHSSTTRDGWIAREPDGTPSQKLLNAWRSVLGDSDADTWLDEVDNCPLVANADQTDTDRDGLGDACDPTPLTRLGDVRNGLVARGPLADQKANKALTGAIAALDDATDAANWDDGARLDAANGRTVYDALVYTVTALQRIDTAWADDAIATIVSLAEEITQLAIDETPAGPDRDRAVLEKARGDSSASAVEKLEHYRKAWALVREA